jgi:hypothetical protein
MSIFGLGGPGTVLEQLDAGLAARTALDTQFQLDLFNRILQLLRELENCPAAVAALPSGTAGALTITQAELTRFIERLQNPDNMGPEAIEDIVDPIYRIGLNGDRSLRRTPGAAISGDASRAVPRASRSVSSSSRPSSSGSPASSGWGRFIPSWGISSPRAGLPRSGAAAYDVSSSNPEVDNIDGVRQPPTATARNSISDDELPPFADLSNLYRNPLSRPIARPINSIGNSSLGGRKTRRARKYRNRT